MKHQPLPTAAHASRAQTTTAGASASAGFYHRRERAKWAHEWARLKKIGDRAGAKEAWKRLHAATNACFTPLTVQDLYDEASLSEDYLNEMLEALK